MYSLYVFRIPAACCKSTRISSTEMIDCCSSLKGGRDRTLRPEEEFFLTLCRLRCGFPLMDLAMRFNMSTGNLSRTHGTWFDFLHLQFRMMTIWATKGYIVKTIPAQLKEAYPATRVIIRLARIVHRDAYISRNAKCYLLKLKAP